MQIVSIVSGLPPAIDGVGDYALNLARQLRKDFGVETHFIVGNPTWTGATDIDGFPISRVSDRSVTSLLSLLPNQDTSGMSAVNVLLHYVSYGYAKRGCPFWLVKGLQQWRTSSSDRFLVTMFHELYTYSPIWSSSFWLARVQTHLSSRLAQLSDRCFTNQEGYAQMLGHWVPPSKQDQIFNLPVFSNVGEPETVPPLSKRPRRLVVFGGATNRRRVYETSFAAIERTCRALEIDEILDIGPPTGLEISQINGVSVVATGERPAPEISRLLSSAIAGFFNYPIDYLGKSTVFAAYCAHRLIPIGTSYNALPLEGLEAGKHFWRADRPLGQLDLVLGQAIADNAYTWYQSHNLSVQAKTFAAHLNVSSKFQC